MSVIHLQYPAVNLKYKIEGNTRYVFDSIRKKYLVLTPEEWVRQHLIAYLLQELHYPINLLSIEKQILVGNIKKRYDLVVYDQDFQPCLLAECKQPNIPITEQTLYQLLQYHSTVAARFWVLTNGPDTFCAQVKNGKIIWRDQLPSKTELLSAEGLQSN